MQRAALIMVVDSDPLTAEKVTEATRDYLCEVVAYSSLESMLEALDKKNPVVDVIVLNLERPFEEAFELLPKLKTRFPETEIVFLTRFDDETLWVEAIQRGAYDLLPRPLDPVELSRILLCAVERHQTVLTIKRAAPSSITDNKARACHSSL
jgi:DNA-binding NtrC family response regulator